MQSENDVIELYRVDPPGMLCVILVLDGDRKRIITQSNYIMGHAIYQKEPLKYVILVNYTKLHNIMIVSNVTELFTQYYISQHIKIYFSLKRRPMLEASTINSFDVSCHQRAPLQSAHKYWSQRVTLMVRDDNSKLNYMHTTCLHVFTLISSIQYIPMLKMP